PCVAGATGKGVDRGGDAEGAGLGNGFAQQVEQRVVDAGILDTGGSEQQFHESNPCRCKRTGQLTSGGSVRSSAMATSPCGLQMMTCSRPARISPPSSQPLRMRLTV